MFGEGRSDGNKEWKEKGGGNGRRKEGGEERRKETEEGRRKETRKGKRKKTRAERKKETRDVRSRQTRNRSRKKTGGRRSQTGAQGGGKAREHWRGQGSWGRRGDCHLALRKILVAARGMEVGRRVCLASWKLA